MVTQESVANQIVVLAPNGRLTAETVDVFEEAVARRIGAGCHDLILDFQNINYLDGAGLGALARAFTSSRRCGGRLVFVNVTGRNEELLRVARLLTLFEVYATISDARRSFADPPEAMVRVTRVGRDSGRKAVHTTPSPESKNGHEPPGTRIYCRRVQVTGV